MAIDVTQKRVNTLELDTHLCDSGAENQPFSDDSEVIALRAQSTVTHYKKKRISHRAITLCPHNILGIIK